MDLDDDLGTGPWDLTAVAHLLTNKQLSTLDRYYRKGESVTEIAASLRLSVSAVSGRLSRGRARVAAFLRRRRRD